MRLSVDKFHENKILAISGLYCSILDIDIKDKSILKLFKKNNPNIFLFNDEINYYIDKFSKNKIKMIKTKKTLNYNKIIKNDNHNINNDIINNKKYLKYNTNSQHFEGDENDSENNSDKSDKSNYDFNNNENYELKNNPKYNNISIEIKNSFLLEIKNYFEELKQVIAKISKKIRTKITAYHLSNDILYINIEKKRILLLYQTYLKLSVFNTEKKTDYFFCKNMNSINSNNFTDSIKIYEIKKYIKCININIRFGLIILITILFYSINLISMKLSVSIIRYILLKFYKFDEHKQVPNVTSFGNFHYLCYYLDNLEDFKSKLKFAEKSQIDLYQNILDILEVKSLILKSNYLKKKKEENENLYKNMGDDNSQKNRVSSLLLFMKELKIDKYVLILIEFFCDFIIYEDMEQVVINGSFNDEYSMLIEIKEILEQTELDKNNLRIKDLSFKKYYKNKLERIFNKFYFENSKIKVVKNKNFNNLENNKISFTSTKFNLLSFIFNWNKDYMKTDEISIKNCFSIDKLIKKGNNRNKYIQNNFREKDFTQNICFSEEKRNEVGTSQPDFQTILLDKNQIITQRPNKNISNKEESNRKKMYYKTNYNNSDFKINSDSKNSILGIKSTINILNNKDSNFDNKNIITNKSNTFKELFKYFDENNKYKKNKVKIRNIYNKKFIKNQLLNDGIENNLKTLRKIINKREIKNKKYYNTLSNKECCYPFNSINQKDAKLKIKRIDTEIVNINAHRLYWKKKYNNSRENIQITSNNFSDGLSVEKYDQARQENIIRKILENKNKKLKEKLNEKKNLNKNFN